MKNKMYKHRKVLLSVLSFWLLIGLIGMHPQIAESAPNLHGIGVATIDSLKRLAPKNGFDTMNIETIPGSLGATIAQIEVDRSIDGKPALLFADIDEKADKGWYFVDREEASYWITRFGGNPNFILGGTANVYSKEVTNATTFVNPPYQAYNLAELATASGGAGFTKGDNLVPNGSGGYKSVGHFRTTPQPSGSVTTDKNKYNVNETVTINANATDYSYYDRGIFVWSLSVINKTTGRGYKSILSNKENRDPSSSIPTVNETSNPPGYNWTYKNTEYKPTEAGLYEVSLTITDLHQRSRQGSSSINVSKPYIAQFTVGDVPPEKPDPEEPEPGPTCSIGSTSTRLDIQVVGDKDIKDHKSVSSGGSDIAVEKNADITLFAKKPGTFKMNGVTMSTGSGGNKKVGTGSIGSSGRVKVVYTSDDGTECWEKYFRVESPDGEDSCPIVTLSASSVRNGETIEIMQFDTLNFKAKYTTKYGDSSDASLKWDVTLPNGKVYTLPVQENDKGRWGPYNASSLKLPYGRTHEPYNVQFERGKTYKLRLNFDGTKWKDRPECDWEITIVVKDASCSIAEQKNVRFLVHSEPPLPFGPEGEALNGSASSGFTLTDPVYMKYFTESGDQYDTNMSFSSRLPGTWYLKMHGEKTALTDKIPANEQFRLMLPSSVDVGDEIVLVFESENGCTGEVKFTIETDKKCWDIMVSVEYRWIDNKQEVIWKKDIKRGETIKMAADEIPDKYSFRMFFSDDSQYSMRWFDPATGNWERKRNGESLSSSNKSNNSHWALFPKDDNGHMLEGLYKVQFYSTQSDGCDGHFFVQIGEGDPKPDPDGENLLIVKSSFKIDPKSPQAAGTEATISFDVKNAGKLTHDTKLAVRWESSPKETLLDVDGFKPGEVRKITVPTKYPQQSEDFIANINPSKDKPDNETIWPDNRAKWPVEVTGGGGTKPPTKPNPDPNPPDPEGPGGNHDGGEIGLEIYDSDDRQLQKLQLNADGVWEREPAKIRVVIDQTKINEGFRKTEQAINQKINEYKDQLQQSVSGDHIKNTVVTATPGWISDAKSMAVYSPSMLDLKVTGPGTPQQWQVSSASTGGDYIYTGTIVPTQTTWRQVLNGQRYKAEINGFVITMDYSIQFDVSYESCSETEDEDGNKEEVCEPKSLSKNMKGQFTITVKGGEREFEVFEPHFTLTLHKTPEWTTIHAKDEYKNSKPNDWYAGEAILTHVNLEPRDRHPVSNKYPVILSATSWMREQGGVGAWMKRSKVKERPYWHQASLPLVKTGEVLWAGPKRDIPDPNHSGKYLLRNREKGVDDGVGRQNKSGAITMGDIWYGLQPGETYSVQALVSFQFGVDKGYRLFDKGSVLGSQPADYNKKLTIIDNALSRILNFTQMK
ncbi:ABC transporter permease [Brevibacillus formosus]|uniref:ABC transporter permease n=1 Tax=Brevibacillus formosus TaxID=54913 RepID=UPI0021556BF1|nr:ABC transporter permease [Brevibacillus formosus]